MSSYETMEVSWATSSAHGGHRVVESICRELVRYGRRLSRRQLVFNSFGNIAIRVEDARLGFDIIYTKPRGISLEEVRYREIVGTRIESNELVFGSTPPSNGHQMSRAIMACRPDVQCVIHTHANPVVAYWSVYPDEPLRFVGNDTPLVLSEPLVVVPRELNLETDPSAVEHYAGRANALVMPNHGLVTLGRSVSEAYHRHTSVVAEVERLTQVRALAGGVPASSVLPDDEVAMLYQLGDKIIYGR